MLGGAKEAFASAANLGAGPATSGTGGGGGGGGIPPPNTSVPKAPKEKKVASLKKQVQQKISFISAKLTDLKVLRNKVENSPL